MVMLIVCERTNIADVILPKFLSNIFGLLCSLVDEIIVSCRLEQLFIYMSSKGTCSKYGKSTVCSQGVLKTF